MYFNGYKRSNGTVGTRNKILIISVDECMEGIARAIANEFEDVIIVTNYNTCMLGGNEETLSNMINIGSNPNVCGVLIMAMGCGSIDPNLVANPISKTGKIAKTLTAIKEQGTRKTIKKGIEILKEIEIEKNKAVRSDIHISNLIVGVKCGGSDTSSGLASNPSVGKASDMLIENGATVVAGELMELVGCEDILLKRACDEQVGKKIIRLINEEEKRWGVANDTEIMSVGNSVGGLTTIEEKALGSLEKIGTKPIVGILEFNQSGHEKPTKKGLYLSDTTMLCGGSAMHFASIGAQLILWTSGGAGFNNELIPVIRVSGNENLINEDIDIDATKIMKNEDTIDNVGSKIFDKVIEVASGQKTNIEGVGYSYCTLYQKNTRLEYCIKKCEL
ncbi:MAG: UxaA family hydrolase [Peptostreptococcaceae bacterium]|jgi:altronate dehydratase large subunit|nr:UxaA family hydrolase [Peptostreptococcaceae bacterium]